MVCSLVFALYGLHFARSILRLPLYMLQAPRAAIFAPGSWFFY